MSIKKSIKLVQKNPQLFRSDLLEWLVVNHHIFDEFRSRALEVARFRTHYSARTIAEVMRHDTAIKSLGDEYKINGNFVPCMARLFALVNPQHKKLFEFRQKAA